MKKPGRIKNGQNGQIIGSDQNDQGIGSNQNGQGIGNGQNDQGIIGGNKGGQRDETRKLNEKFEKSNSTGGRT